MTVPMEGTRTVGGAGGTRRKPPWRSILPPMAAGALLFAGYFVVPFTDRWSTHTALWLAGGLTAVCALIVWQVRAIRHSPTPLARALGTLTVSVPLFLIVFAVTYVSMAAADAASWSEPLSRLDALYFTITVFATVGFGDITPVSEAARAVVTVQMAGDLIVVGVIARVVVHAVREGLARRSPDEP